MSYAKLFSSITESSLWCEPKEVRLLFVSMLARADATGFVEAALPGLAKLSNLSLSEVEIAVKVLSSADVHSKNKADEGRRIIEVPGGWMLLNYEDYRNRQGEQDRRDYMRKYMQKYRSKLSKQNVSTVNASKDSPSASASLQERGEREKLPFTSERFFEAWESWQAHRIEIKKPLKPTQTEKQLKMLASIGEERAVAMIEHTIEKGWQGLREEDIPGKGRNEQPPSQYQELEPLPKATK